MGLMDRLFGPPTPERFARQLLAALRRARDPREARYNPDKFQIRFYDEGRDAGIANLRNFYEEHCRVPRAERPRHLKHLVRGLLTYLKQVPADFEDARPDLRPIVRARSYFEFLRLQSEIEGHAPPDIPCHEVGDHLCAALVYDLPESMQSINREQLEGWDIGYYQALEIARQNLRETDFAVASVDQRMYVSATGDNYDSSRLLLVEMFEDLDLDGRPVAVVPNRDTLVITGSEDDAGLRLAADFIEEAMQLPRPMSAIPMILEEGEWKTWRLAPDHPQAARFRLLEIKSLGAEYAEQQELLETLYERQGLDLFVATYSAVAPEEEAAFSYCLWSQGIDAILPRTQKILFYWEGMEGIYGGNWEDVARIVGDLLEPLDLYPPRFRVQEFPSRQQLEAIGRLTL